MGFLRRLLGGQDEAKRPEAPNAAPAREDRRTEIPPDGIALYAGAGGLLVVGSQHYRTAVKRAVGRMGPQGVTLTVALVPEPTNPYDPNAISVQVDDQIIGYLQKATAKSYRTVMGALAQRGLTGYCRVDIKPDPNPEYDYSVHVFVDTSERQLELIAEHDAR
ncbi:MAG TPA: HIRAN domain-containing protein [Candidatus Limnocylindrales bacterium]